MRVPSYCHGTSDTPLLGDTIGVNFERTVGRFADRPALVSRHQDVRLTYAQLDAAVDAAAAGLLRSGIGAGDRVGIWAPNCAEWVVVQYATAKVGAILVNVNPAYRTHELEYVLRQSGARLLFSASAFKTSDYAAMIDEVAGAVDTLERTVFIDRPEWAEFCAGEPDRDAIAARMAGLSFDDPINIQYTSGTTGFPKGATLSHHNILNNGFFVTELLGLTRGRPHVPAGALLPLLRDGHGQPRDARPRRLRRHPGPVVRGRARRSRRSPPRASPRSTACRRCSSPCSATRTSSPST